MGRGSRTLSSTNSAIPRSPETGLELSSLNPPAIDEQWAQAILPAARLNREAAALYSSYRKYRQYYGDSDERTQRYLTRAQEKEREAEELYAQISAPFDAEFERRGGWSRYVIVCNSNGHIHSQPALCRTLIPGQTIISPVYQLSGASDEEMIKQSGHTACSKCFPAAPVLTFADKQQLSKEKAAEKKALQAAKRAEKDTKKAIRDQSLATKVNGLLEVLPPGLGLRDLHMWYYTHPEVNKKFTDSSFDVAEEIYHRRQKS